jgi:hypothetical protein
VAVSDACVPIVHSDPCVPIGGQGGGAAAGAGAGAGAACTCVNCGDGKQWDQTVDKLPCCHDDTHISCVTIAQSGAISVTVANQVRSGQARERAAVQ